ncbi:hypothetical protein [Streptomyces sp. NPDC127197]|uniref:hypothetical protein n=1 Tax=Streptomyces sp. NPDC127197 TaxID=3345388 RepID=UPI003635EC8B
MAASLNCGAAKGSTPHPPLAPGDTVTLTAEHLGSQTVRVAKAAVRPTGDLRAASHPDQAPRTSRR